MRAFVFTDKALSRHAGQFVWLSIDTEKAQNASFVKKYPIRAWPSFYVIDPNKETIALRWVGGATVSQLEKIFADGIRAARGKPKGADEALARADLLYGAGKYAEAAPAYREALRLMPRDAPQYARAAESLLFCLQSTDQHSECVRLARESLPRLRQTASAANLAGSGLDCALALPAAAPGRAEAIAALESEASAVIADRKLALAADNRSALYGSLVSAREDAKDEEGSRRIARDWVAYLDGEAARVASAEQRTALDPNRLNAYRAAGEIEKAVPMLAQSEKDFPDDYNPPARLAYVYLHLKRYDEALAASDRALSLVYGPRKIRVFSTLADIHKAKGDTEAAKKTLEDALAYAESLPPGQRSDSAIASLKKRLETLTAPGAGS
ncbi:MAG TPA: tetratricopeptide repeat protein [Thermoanaerobaculia bacterium]